MSLLTRLPTELLSLVFDELADTSFQSLFVARGACKVFDAIITDTLEKTTGNCLQLVGAEQHHAAGCITTLYGSWVVFRSPDEAEETGLRD
jgi:hypothetical protein